MNRQPPEVIEHWISTILSEGRGVTKWEQTFVEDLAEQIEESGTLSERQEEILESIYAKRTA